jgi:hypothetical protein
MPNDSRIVTTTSGSVKYAEKLRDLRWIKKRKAILERDEYRCRDCRNEENGPLHVHHCFYESGDPWETADEFLLTLCEECHAERQEFEDSAKRLLGTLFTMIGPWQVYEIGKKIHREIRDVECRNEFNE